MRKNGLRETGEARKEEFSEVFLFWEIQKVEMEIKWKGTEGVFWKWSQEKVEQLCSGREIGLN